VDFGFSSNVAQKDGTRETNHFLNSYLRHTVPIKKKKEMRELHNSTSIPHPTWINQNPPSLASSSHPPNSHLA
jgi:hypothetical protein